MTGPDGWQDLLDRVLLYEQNQHFYESAGFKETETRVEFIDPLLATLGWDLDNGRRLSPESREVKREENQSQDEDGAADLNPDYTLSAHGRAQFYVEAKRPKVDIRTSMSAVLQARSYGWTAGHPIVVLTNFKDLIIYDATVKPDALLDTTDTALVARWRFSEFEQKWPEIQALLGRDEVHHRDWSKGFKTYSSANRIPAGATFITDFNQWRVMIGGDLIRNNPRMSGEEVNDAVQQILNRFVFVRMCEDRGIEGEEALRKAFASGSTEISDLFKRLDDRYNTGLFAGAGTAQDPIPKVSGRVLDYVVGRLYSPASPFSFAVLDADFLGHVYEASLAQHLVIDPGNLSVSLNEKLEYERRDVVTTPQGLVTASVRRSVAALDDATDRPKVLDFAVGSGRFLLRAFDEIADRELVRAIAAGDTNLRKVGPNDWRLPFERKRDLLVDNFFGIDIDYNAVEVARFSLIVRLLQDEAPQSLPRGRKILPDLTANIVHGNTLVRAMPPGAPASAEDHTRPLDLTTTALPDAFDLVVGNPPYMDTEGMKNYDKYELIYLKSEYETAHKQFDKYFAFMEFALGRIVDGGVVGVVIPNKWMTAESATKLRRVLRQDASVVDLANFREVQVFEGKSIYVCALVAKKATLDLVYSEPLTIDDYIYASTPARHVRRDDLPFEPTDPWVLPADDLEAKIFEAILRDSVPLGEVVDARVGAQTSRNPVYVITNGRVAGNMLTFEKTDPATKQPRTWSIELAAVKPYLNDSAGVKSHHEVVADAHIVFPYRPTSNAGKRSGFEVIPDADMKRAFPQAYAYLLAHKSELDRRHVDQRARAQAFYVYGRTQAIGTCALAPKIFYSANQRGEKYGLDTTGIVYQSGGTAGEVALYPGDRGYSLDFILGLLDQAPVELYLRKRGSPFRGGYFSRGRAVIVDVPVPDLDFALPADKSFHDDVASRTAQLRRLHSQRVSAPARQARLLEQRITQTSRDVSALFLSRWQLTDSDIKSLRL